MIKKAILIILSLFVLTGAAPLHTEAQESGISVKSGGRTLIKDVDYTLSYRDNIKPGTATVVVTFIGNYAGTAEQTFNIVRKRSGGGSSGRGIRYIPSVNDGKKEYAPPYINGYEDNTFSPEARITRAEATTALLRAAQIEVKDNVNSIFDDISEHWAVKYIETAAGLGVVNGYEDGSFQPDAEITRAELAKIIAVYCGCEPSTATIFTDTEGHWAEGYISALVERGVIDGYEDKTYRPDTAITRAETVKIINHAVPRDYAPGTEMRFSDVAPTHWAYNEILKAAAVSE